MKITYINILFYLNMCWLAINMLRKRSDWICYKMTPVDWLATKIKSRYIIYDVQLFHING